MQLPTLEIVGCPSARLPRRSRTGSCWRARTARSTRHRDLHRTAPIHRVGGTNGEPNWRAAPADHGPATPYHLDVTAQRR